jgi:hypothetical protein
VLITTYAMQEDQTTAFQQTLTNQGFANVVGPNDKPCLHSVFSERKKKKIQKKKNAHKVALVAKAFKSKHDKFFESLNSENVQSALLTRAATCRKKLIEPIVILDVKHRKTLILKSLSGWPMLIYGMCLFRTYLETQELGQLLSSIRPTQILL